MAAPFAPTWVRDAVFYQVFPDRFANGEPFNDPPGTRSWGGRPTRTSFFGGDLQGITEKLGYLQDLGITALYLNPVFDAPSNHKYDTRDYYRVDPHLGGDESLRDLLRSAHGRGVRVVLDGVFNHTGDEFPAFRDLARNGPRSPYWDWYTVEGFPLRRQPRPTYRACGAAPFLPKLNLANPATRTFVLEVATYWIREFGIDGWRLDVPWDVSHDVWRDVRAATKAVNPDAFLVGELWGDALPWLRGDQFDGAINYTLRDLCLKFFAWTQLDAGTFDRELALLRRRPGPHPVLLNLLGSHDTERFLTACGDDHAKARMAVAFLLTYVGTPMVYYGDEVGLRGGTDPDSRRCMEWDPARQDGDLLELHRRLIGARHRHPALRHGRFRTLVAQDGLYAYARESDDDAVVVVLHNGWDPSAVEIRVPRSGGQSWREVLTDERYPVRGGRLCARLERGAILVLEGAG